MKTALILSLALVGCTKDGLPTPTTVAVVKTGVDAASCFLERYVADETKGMGEAGSIAEAALFCGLTEAEGSGLLASYRKAKTLEAAISK